MTRRQELTEVLLEYLSDPDFELASIRLRAKNKVLSMNLDDNVFSLTDEPFDGILVENSGLYGHGMGLRSILESMKTSESTER